MDAKSIKAHWADGCCWTYSK